MFLLKTEGAKTVAELEAARLELEVACHSFAGTDGKGAWFSN